MKRTMEHPSTAHAPPAKKSPYFIPRAGNPPSPPPGVTAEMCSFDICSKRLTEDDAKKLADHDRSFHRRHAVHTAINNQSKIITKAINKQSAAITAAINEQTEVLKEHTAAINNHTAAINDQYE
ncbi:hypothetical protein BGZ97_007429 [Linnemannia gamsii]|uniref:Uncharacterized protein n=1 Tax=Linnemannia gamsii TaxID=64522 RepID=A0A9P6RCN3_9FUNG|nr:hypothetical protein BGZ97_007429 [Linnemannia gamsii]